MAASLAAMNPSGGGAPSSLVATGTYTRFPAASADAYSLRIEILGTDQLRWDLSGNGPLGTTTTVVSGDSGWNRTSGGTVNLSVAQVAEIAEQWFPLHAVAKWSSSPNITGSYIGMEMVGGAAVHHIAITRTFTGTATPEFQRRYQALRQCELYISPDTNLPARIRYYSHPNGSRSKIPMDLVFSSYTQVSGIWLPMQVSQYVGDSQTKQIAFQNIAVNAPVPPSDFSQE